MNAGISNDVWRLNPAMNTWTPLTTSGSDYGTQPAPREWFGFAFSVMDRRFYVMGGFDVQYQREPVTQVHLAHLVSTC